MQNNNTKKVQYYNLRRGPKLQNLISKTSLKLEQKFNIGRETENGRLERGTIEHELSTRETPSLIIDQRETIELELKQLS